MMKVIEDAVARFGVPWVTALLQTTGCHSLEEPPDRTRRFLFGLLEVVDYVCPSFFWGCRGYHCHVL